MAESAVIFDVDGVLLDLTDDEAELFFTPFADYLDARALSRDWNSYAIRNDEDIVSEILARHGLDKALQAVITRRYLTLLEDNIRTRTIVTHAIAGAGELLQSLTGQHTLGIATANFRAAAKCRLEAAGLWRFVSAHAFGADGGGHKHEILARTIGSAGIAAHRIVYVGDNRNDVEAALRHGVHFIGFSSDAARRRDLAAAGAIHLAASHLETLGLIPRLLQA